MEDRLHHSLADGGTIPHYTALDRDPVQYLYNFDEFARWVDGSLEIYRQELSRLLYPVFIHTYLALVRNGLSAEAHRLMSKCKRRFTESPTEETSSMARQELQDLAHVSVAQHLETNKTAQAACSSRYPVTLSHSAFNLVIHFLQTSRLYLVLAIVNQHIQVKVGDGGPEKGGVQLMSQGQQTLEHTDTRQLKLGLLQGNLEDVYLKQQEEKEADKEREAEAEGDGKQLTKKEKQARAKDQAAKKDKRKEESSERIEPEIPLLSLPEEVERARLTDIEHRVPLSADQLPSCLFYTCVNTAHSLCTLHIAAEGTLVAGGFSDSSVRLYDFAPSTSRGENEGDGQPMETDESRVDSDDEDESATPHVTVLHGHSDSVYGLSLSQDGMYVLSASGDGTVRLWSPDVKANLVAYRGHVFPVWDVAMCPTGRYFVSGGADRVARLWATEHKQPLRIFAGHQSDVEVVSWHPNMHYVATGSSDRTVRLWDVKQGNSVQILPGLRAAVASLAFSPNGRSLVAGDAEGGVVVWDLAAAKARARMIPHKGAVWSLSFSQGEGALLVSGGADRRVCLWDDKHTSKPPPGPGGTASAKAGKEEQLPLVATWHTRETPVYNITFTRRNLMVAGGAMMVKRKRNL